jgi:hypothetical protein
MDDKIGFELKDKAFQEEVEKERKKIRDQLAAEIESGKHPRFHKGQTTWLLSNYPYASGEERNKAVSAEEARKRKEHEDFQAEVEKKLGASRTILEALHFGKNGRQFAMEQSKREEKIIAFKAKQEQARKKEEEQKSRTTEQSKKQSEKLIQSQKETKSLEQDNSKRLKVRSDFNKEAQSGKARTEANNKIASFKRRQRDKQKAEKEKSKTGQQRNGGNKKEKYRAPLRDDFNKQVSIGEYDEWKANESKEQTFKQKIRADFTKSVKDKSSEIER